jgi:hypothetical protein
MEGSQKVLPDVHDIVFDASESQHKRYRSGPTSQARRFRVDPRFILPCGRPLSRNKFEGNEKFLAHIRFSDNMA